MYAAAQGLTVVYEGMEYTPTAGTEYLEQFFLPGQPDPLFSGQIEQGIYQINIVTPFNEGRGGALTRVAALITAYSGSVFVATKGRVGITKSWVSTPIDERPWHIEVLNFEWRTG